MGKNKDAVIGFMIVMVIIAIIAGVVYLIFSPKETKTESESDTAEEIATEQSALSNYHSYDEVMDFVKNYQGKDNSGQKLTEIIVMIIIAAYPGEKILDNPSTNYGFDATPIEDYTDIGRHWNARFYIETYRESTTFEWAVDMKTKEIYPSNQNGKDVLAVLDAYE